MTSCAADFSNLSGCHVVMTAGLRSSFKDFRGPKRAGTVGAATDRRFCLRLTQAAFGDCAKGQPQLDYRR